MTSALMFPPRLMREASNDWNIVANTQGVGLTSAASVDVRSDGGGLWMAALNDIQFRDQSDARLWRAVRQICNGGVVPIVVPRNDAICAPFPTPGPTALLLSFDDGGIFDDGGEFSQRVIDVACSGGAALRATAMTLQLNNCAALQGGESFSILHPTFGWRLYEIATATIVDATHSAITFNPPLREAVDAGAWLEFDLPRCTMKLAAPGAMDLNFTTWPFSTPSVKFIESKYAT